MIFAGRPGSPEDFLHHRSLQIGRPQKKAQEMAAEVWDQLHVEMQPGTFPASLRERVTHLVSVQAGVQVQLWMRKDTGRYTYPRKRSASQPLEQVHTNKISCGTCKHVLLKDGMLDGVENADTTRARIVLMTNSELPSHTREVPMIDWVQPLAQSSIKSRELLLSIHHEGIPFMYGEGSR
jgi:hypothetical protein